MGKSKILYWLPRILGIAYILFLAIFALDIFVPGQPWYYYPVGLFMHLIPNFILAIILFIAWKWEKIGGVIFLVSAAIMFCFFQNPLSVNLPLFGPVFLIGLLFIADNYLIKRGLK